MIAAAPKQRGDRSQTRRRTFTHIQLDNPEKRDEEEVECHKETEGAADIRDSLALCRWHQHVRRREGQRCGVGGVKGGDGREASPELPILSSRHSCCETGNSPFNSKDIIRISQWKTDT